jgi:hypothetical protein
MDAIGGHHTEWSKPGLESQRPDVFSYTWKIDSKDKYKYKNKHDNTQTHM